MKNMIIKCVIFVVALILLTNSMFFVYPNEYKIIKQFGRVEKIIEEPGLNFKIPFVQNIDMLPKNIIVYDQAPSDVITKDKKAMVVDNYVLWKINDPMKFIKTINRIPEAERRIETVVYNAIKNNLGNMNQSEIIEGRNTNLNLNISESVKSAFEQYGIEIIRNEIKKLDLPADNKASVYNRMISERTQIAAEFLAEGTEEAQKITNETNKETSIILSNAKATAEQTIAEGEKEYMKIISNAYSTPARMEFYEYMRSLDAIKKTMTGDKTLFLPIDSPLTNVFLGE